MRCNSGIEGSRTRTRTPTRPRPRSRDRGSGTVLVVAAVGVVLASAFGAFMVLGAVLASHRAHAAADLAALAGAAALVRGESPGSACVAAGSVSARNAASLVSCVAGADLSVEIVVSVPANAPGLGAAGARARAGPAEPRAG